MSSGSRLWARLLGAATVSATALSLLTAGAVHSTTPSAYAASSAPRAATARTVPGAFSVTMVTGDRAVVTPTAQGQYAVSLMKRQGRENVAYTIRRTRTGLNLVPADALGLIAQHRLDPRLFDLLLLKKWNYDDAHTRELPLLTSAGAGARTLAAPPAPAGTRAMRSMPALGLTSVRQSKDDNGRFWTALTAPAAARSPAVGKIWLVGKRQTTLDVSVPQIGAPAAWANGNTGKGAKVAVVDTGIDAHHPDLEGVVVAAKDFTGSAAGVKDEVGHGTHVAGIIAGRGTASRGRYRGVAKDASLVSAKVCDLQGCADDAILAGMDWAVNSGAKVINMSLGGTAAETGDPIEDAVNSLTADRHVLFVVAAGNDGLPETIGSPGTADSALTVGSVDKRTDELSAFSSQGPRVVPSRRYDYGVKPDITAPGADIVSTRAAGTGEGSDKYYVPMTGTSMATPHVAGAAAILAVEHPGWGPDRLKSTLMSTAKFQPGQTVYQQGAGRLDLARATTQRVTATGSLDLGYFPWPDAGATPVSRTVTYTNHGMATVTLKLALSMKRDGKAAAAGMFTTSAKTVTVKAGRTASVGITAKTSLGARGLYGGTLSATSADGKIKLQTAVGAYREPESYNVSYLQLNPGPGSWLTDLELVNTKTGEIFTDAFQGAGTRRVPAGKYTAYAVTYDTREPALGVRSPTVEIQPLTVDKPAELVLDARRRKPVRLTIDRPVAPVTSAGTALFFSAEDDTSMTVFAGDGNLYTVPPRAGSPQLTYAVTSTLVKQGSPATPFTYNLILPGSGTLPGGLTHTFKQADLATVKQTVRRQAPEEVRTLSYGGLSETSDVSASPSIDLGRLTKRTDYFSTRPDTEFNNLLTSGSREADGSTAIDWLSSSASRGYKKGSVSTGNAWNAAVFGPVFDPPQAGIAERSENDLNVSVPLRTATGGYTGDDYADTGSTKLSRNGKVLWSGSLPGDVNAAAAGVRVPAAKSTYRLVTVLNRSAPWGSLSRRVAVDWTFTSKYSQDQVYLPLQVVSWTPKLDDDNRAAAGPFTVPLHVYGVDRSKTAKIKAITVDVSYNDGRTWARAALTGSGATRKAAVRNPAGGSVSLRATVVDPSGNKVKQTITGAYRVR
jgi:subtilisin family serine protease